MNKEKYDKSYFEAQEKTASSPYSWEIKRYHLEIIAETIRHLNPIKVLDIGCAKGFLVYLLLKKNIQAYGIDISKYAIENALSDIRDRLFIVNIECEKLPFADEYFDLIIGLEVIEHLETTDNIINECYRVLRPKGYLFFTTPVPGSWDAKNDITHINVHPYKFWRKLFIRGGFSDLEKKSYRLFLKEFIKNYKKFISFAPSERGIINFLYKFGWVGKFIRSQLQVYINFFSPFKTTQLLIFRK